MLTHTLKQNRLFVGAISILFCATIVNAQTTSFSYQGRLTDGGTAANGAYDLQFAMFDTVAGGTQIGATQTFSDVPVGAGIFSVTLDFGAGVFPGASRYLEIKTRLTGAGSFTTLTPRQQITSTPYAVQALSATTAENLTTAGGRNFIQNTTTQQTGGFNISGSGTADGTLLANTVRAKSLTGYYGLIHTDSAANAITLGTYVVAARRAQQADGSER